MLTDSIIVTVINNAKLTHDLASNSGLYSPISSMTVLDLPFKHDYINDLGT